MYRARLNGPDDFDGWRDAARALTLAGIAPADIVWQDGEGAGDLFAADEPLPVASGAAFSVPRAFVELAETAILHRDPERFALLYALLARLRDRPASLEDRADPLVRRVESLAKAVRRDMHKMRAFVRFRELADAQGPRFVAWFEPDHHIVRANAGFFVRRFASMRWSILTPELSIHWDGEALTEGPGATGRDAPGDDPVEDIWKGYYAAIFNPARLKVGAMLSEMPRKYWRNLPEAALIPELVAGAQTREAAMIATPPKPAARHGNAATAWSALREEAMGCIRCPLYRDTTQTVFGEGPVDAPLMFIGEQPGDQEDLAGRPFVGPAGQLFDRALEEAGIDRRRAYITNAVKHFKHERRGKRRIHQTPETPEIQACRWWLTQELELVRPRIIVALGATAGRALLGKAVTISRLRGAPLALEGGAQGWITVHPSYLLRVPEETRKAEERKRFVEELREIGERVKALV
ncbi:uracil-DNA glycosylase [Sphingobium sp. 22B]|uniref:UdgX family uracil-DNA binding protein n=1 Tax=unclassified Sphingobium TaxID=2611147 RepID=UPI0007816830|nr:MULTISPECIES: UdgX family uracil-DNA binding protein [unclassified Sphingobium]KXU30305.1 uracil-DNA glycosylase [Sphingobium sp. AM]KYC32422.1 uracil-DNA glycosylase [Sphingobium sp. 22B]OAP32051.1 uracil-DNA glycosylase [Sphingobium sp. 20006FA]